VRPTPGTRAAGHGISPGTERLPGDSGPARVGGPSTAHPRPNPKVRRSAPSRSRRSSALQSYATLALYVPHASPLSIAQRPSMRLDTSPRSPRSDPLPHHRRSRVPAGCRCTTSGLHPAHNREQACRGRRLLRARHARRRPRLRSRLGCPGRSETGGRVGAGHRLWPRAESGGRLTPRTKHRRGSLSHEQRLELRKSAEQVGEAAHAVAHGLVRQREVRAGARLDTGEAPEDVPPRVPQPAADHEYKPAWT